MRKAKTVIAALLILTLCLTAAAESSLTPFIDAAERLAFDTHNVTITGKADFLLDGERFKTAEITYVQDGENSFWQEKLLTPRPWKPDLESGFTVIQNGWDIYVMEALKPGQFREGSDGKQNTLLRRSAVADLLLTLARAAADQLEPLFGSAVTVTEQAGGARNLRFELKDGDAPAVLNILANLGLRFAGKRLLGIDAEAWDAFSVTGWTKIQTILYATKDVRLKDCSVLVSMDEQGRLTGLSGECSALLVSYTAEELEAVRDQEEYIDGFTVKDGVLTVRFDAALSQYGESTVKPFDPRDYLTVPPEEQTEPEREEEPLTEAQEAAYQQYALAACKAAGYETVKYLETEMNNGIADVRVDTEGGICYLCLSEDGMLLELFLEKSDIEGNEEMPDYPDELPDEVLQPMVDFLRAVNPELKIPELVNMGSYGDGTSTYLDVEGRTEDGEETGISMTVRMTPAWRVEDYSCVGGHG